MATLTVGEAAGLAAAQYGGCALRGTGRVHRVPRNNGLFHDALVVNVIQLIALVVFAGMAIAYRLLNPDATVFLHPSARRDVLHALVTQCLFAYLFEYFAANCAFAR